MEEQKKFLDLSHPLASDMPKYPDAKQPRFIPSASIIDDGYRELFIEIQTHTGTHIDAPSHILNEGKTISDFNINKFCGSACVLQHNFSNPISIEQMDAMTYTLNSVDFVLINTGWDKFWGQEKYFKDFPAPGNKIVEYLSRFKLKGIGIDAISIDPISSNVLTNHHLLLSKEIIIIENLTNLSMLNNQVFQFFCFPLAIKNGDGSPVRAIAEINT